MRRRRWQANMRTCCTLMRLAYTLKGMTTLNSVDSTLYPSRIDIAFKSLWRFIPEPLLHYVRYLPLREYHRFRTFLDFSENFSRDIVKESTEKSDGKDMISVLLRANASENPSNKLTDDELIYQITCANIPSSLNYSKSPLFMRFSHTVLCSSLGMIPPQTP